MITELTFDIPFDQEAEDANDLDYRFVDVPDGFAYVRSQLNDGTWTHPTPFSGDRYVLLKDKALQKIIGGDSIVVPDDPARPTIING